MSVGAVAFALAGGVVAAPALYLLTLALAALRYRPPRRGHATRRVVVLVPAHDEAGLIGRCVRSLLEQDYARNRYEVVVVADNCRDATADLAAAAGARVLVRHEPAARGKGHALRWAMDRVLAAPEPPDAIAVVDADSVADHDFLTALVAPMDTGAVAVQGESLLTEDGSPRTALRAAAFLLVNRVRPAGRAVLHLPCHLCGNGLLLSAELLRAHPWDAFSSTEDAEYDVHLRSAGVRPCFAGGAILRSAAAPTARAAAEQQLRWEGGKLHMVRTWAARLAVQAVRERRPSLLDTALEVVLPPLGLLAASCSAGAIAGAALVILGVLPAAALTTWLAGLLAIPLFVLVGLRAARAPGSSYRALARAPMLVVAKVLSVPRLLAFRADSWVRTER